MIVRTIIVQSIYLDTSPDVVKLYEQLFFNVRDRMHEKCHISHIAWPQTRQVEYQFAYNQREDAGYLMMRASRNHGSAVALNFAGHGTAVTEIDSSLSTGRMESMVMSSGLDDARMGFSSQGGDVPNIRRAQDIIKANKAGGNDDRNSDEVMGSPCPRCRACDEGTVRHLPGNWLQSLGLKRFADLISNS